MLAEFKSGNLRYAVINLCVLIGFLSTQAQAEAIQVGLWDYSTNAYVVSLDDSENGTYPLNFTLGDGEVVINRVDGEQPYVCAKHRANSTSPWMQKCQMISGNSGGVKWSNGWGLAIVSSENGMMAPGAQSANGVLTYATNSEMSCPEGEVEECYTIPGRTIKLEKRHGGFIVSIEFVVTEPTEVCYCVEDGSGGSGPEEGDPEIFVYEEW